MNKLPLAKRTQILAMLCEGSSMRSISRITDVSINTVSKLLAEAGEACLAIHDDHVQGVVAKRVQCDEIWAFCYSKQRNVATAKAAPEAAGDVWTWTAIDADSKLIISYLSGSREAEYATAFLGDLQSRITDRIQLSADGLGAYVKAVEDVFGADVDFGQLIKQYAPAVSGPGRYSPPRCTGARRVAKVGRPDQDHISTSYVERMNLNIRMANRRLTRLTNAFSKKFENHVHALAIYFAFYNFCRIHKTLRVTPAMAAGIADTVWTLEDIVAKMDAMAPAPTKRGPYKKRAA